MEMNLHMPQDPESEAELKNLAAVPYQIVSPANNASIIGIYQDSMLGSYLFSRNNIKFSPRQAMNLLMMFNGINEEKLLQDIEKEGGVTNFNILSQIMPPLTIKNKIEVRDGTYIRGQMDKGVLGSRSKGLLQRICNDFGNMASAKFIDDLQNIVTEYMKSSGFSVGISDLISNQSTNDEIVKVITQKKTEVKNLIDQVQMGIFENNTGKTNEEEFETQVNSILNQATSEAGKIGLKNLSAGNRFVTMVQAGSKGSDLNISFMISCLGQQNVDGKRIPYGFEHRTLPHFTKYDDSPGARGFVESSYINGLSPQELFMHAMGGRVGLIDTAVKTSTTGYIQRRLIKGLEDLKVEYDMTIRTNKNKIVQFQYGDDGIDTTKVEDQEIPIVEMTTQDIYNHYLVPEETGKVKTLNNIFLKNTMTRYKKQQVEYSTQINNIIGLIIENRELIIKNVFKGKGEKVVSCPVSFSYIINNIQGQCSITSSSLVDITLLEALELIQYYYENLSKMYYTAPTNLFKVLYFYYLSPKELLIIKRFNKASLTLLLDTIMISYKRAIVAPGEMVGMIAGQSIGEVSTQMSVPYETKHKILTVNKKTGLKQCKTIIVGEFCDQLIKENPQFTFNTGHLNSYETLLEKLQEEYYIQSVTEDERTKWSKLSHISRHPVNGQMMRIYTKSGRNVESTPSHSHLVRIDHKVQPIIGSDMREGMRIPVCKNIVTPNQLIQHNITLDDGSDVLLDENFGWFIGAYLSEGNLNYHEISITNISGIYINRTQEIASKFEKSTRICKKQGEYGLSITTKFTHKSLSKMLLNECGNGSYVKKVPDFAFNAPIEFKKGLFQGYFDGDGNFQSDKNYHQIRCCSRSKQLIKDLSLMLNSFGIFGSIKIENKKDQNLYHLNISSKYAKLYYDNIGTQLHNDKLLDIIKFLERDNKSYLSEQIDKIDGFGELIAYCGKTLKLPGQSRTYGFWKNKQSIGRRTLEKYYNTFKNHSDANLIENELKLIEKSLNSDVVWDEVTRIEYYTPEQNNFVYDFTVPGCETFMTDYGVFVHNTLNTFHFAGVASKSNVTRGVPRIEEILSLSSEIKNPSLSVYLKPDDERHKEKAQTIMYMLEHTKLQEIVKSTEICFDPDDLNTLINEDKECIEQYKAFENLVSECNEMNLESGDTEKSKWIIRMIMDPEVMLEKNITMDDVNFTLKSCFEDQISCIYSDFNSDKLIFRISINDVIKSGNSRGGQKKIKVNPLDQSDQIYILKNFQEQLLQKVVLRGIEGLNKVILRKVLDNVVELNGVYKKQDIWVLDTIGTNLLDVLGLDYIDNTRTISNDIIEIYNILGIEAARQTIYNELVEVVEFDGTYINYHNYSVLVDRMTFTHKLISIFRHGINNDNIGPIAKASFEETPEQFLKAARHAELDTLRGISANVMCGQEGFFGTAAFQVILDIEQMQKLEASSEYKHINVDDEIEKIFGDSTNPDDPCASNKITIQNNVITIKGENMGYDNDSYNPGF
jgi:DNA-directed RNA polymerase beta' subunit